MAQPTKKTIAERAVKTALELAQKYADIKDPNDAAGAAAFAAADEARALAAAAVAAAGLVDEFTATLETAGTMIGTATPPAPPAPDPEPEPVIDYHTIAEGHALTSRRGILGPGKRINPADLPGGAKALKAFVKSGHVLKPAG